MKALGFALVTICFSVSVHADTYGPLRSTTNGKVVGMIFVEGNGGEAYVRASVSTLKTNNANTAWIFCRDEEGMRLRVDRLDGNIGSRTLEGVIDVETFCPDGIEIEIVVINHGKPVEAEVGGVPGSVIQVTTNNNTDPFCIGAAQPPRVCKVVATGTALLP